MDILIGADPELFVRDTTTGKFVSAHGMIEGTKAAPLPVTGGAVQVDGMALEFNINPASNVEEFAGNIKSVLGELRKMVPDKYEFVFTSVAEFDPAYIKDQPEEARKLGCEPDFNAYTGEANPAPNAAKSFRTASGHLHVGWTQDQDIKDPDHLEACTMLVQELDGFVGAASVIIDPLSKRRELYGKAGAFRPKPYGVEYRTPSNVWLTKDSYIADFYEKTLLTTQWLLEGKKMKYRGVRTSIDRGAVLSLFRNLNYSLPVAVCLPYAEAIEDYIATLGAIDPRSETQDKIDSVYNMIKVARLDEAAQVRKINIPAGRAAPARPVLPQPLFQQDFGAVNALDALGALAGAVQAGNINPAPRPRGRVAQPMRNVRKIGDNWVVVDELGAVINDPMGQVRPAPVVNVVPAEQPAVLDPWFPAPFLGR